MFELRMREADMIADRSLEKRGHWASRRGRWCAGRRGGDIAAGGHEPTTCQMAKAAARLLYDDGACGPFLPSTWTARRLRLFIPARAGAAILATPASHSSP
jgi:hypothetical protein